MLAAPTRASTASCARQCNSRAAPAALPRAPGARSGQAASRCPPTRVASLEAAPVSQAVRDAQRRELETLARRQAQAALRAAEMEAEASGQPWWEVDCPDNMRNVACLEELRVAVESAPGLVVVNFFAPECYACRSMQPKLRQIARANPGVLFLKVNGLVGDLKQYVEDMEISRIPFFHLYRSNRRVAAFSANMRPEKLQLLRGEIAEHSRAAEQQQQQPVAAA